ncbi:meprin A subunit beta [Monodelphis domestica]|uniref:meprin A subunit beta n=1 Tax=Monodelphis domestica TaxID=13616 RepID=UPI0024E198A2|nr:meprin A subunit beta [Monodelphis domestica]
MYAMFHTSNAPPLQGREREMRFLESMLLGHYNYLQASYVYTDRNAAVGDEYRQSHVVPYVLHDSLEMDSKGVILNAFERFRLKTCIDFKPREEEEDYILFYKGKGCFSYLGNKRFGQQLLSIGDHCSKVGSVQNQLLYLLGFYHQQARSDRDDYIIIMEDRIKPDTEINFEGANEEELDSLNDPYDYKFMMYYSKNAFQKGTELTIVERIPNFMDVIGQRIDFSDYDLEKLNQLYNCSSSKTFMDSCDFDQEDICGMIQSSEDNADWQRVSQVPGGPDTDQTYLGKCKGCSFFMHFNSSSVKEGEKAVLQSRLFHPRRAFQCLQFYYYNGGNKNDQLKIYVREHTSANLNDSLTLVHEVKDPPIGNWELYYVPLNVTKKFRVVFEGTRGFGTSAGGLSIDDLNLSETQCPQHIWKISNFTKLNSSREIIFSPPFYSPKGYAFQVHLNLTNEDKIGIYFSLISGANDEYLEWPCPWQQATVTLLDQNPDIRRSMSHQRSVTTDPFKKIENSSETFFWDKPSKVGVTATFPNGTSYSRGPAFGIKDYIIHKWMQRRDFAKGDNVYILLTVDDISHLRSNKSSHIPLKMPTLQRDSGADLCENFHCENDGVCVIYKDKAECRCRSLKDLWFVGEKCQIQMFASLQSTVEALFLVTSFAVAVVASLLSFYYGKKKYGRRKNARTSNMTIENVSMQYVIQ